MQTKFAADCCSKLLNGYVSIAGNSTSKYINTRGVSFGKEPRCKEFGIER